MPGLHLVSPRDLHTRKTAGRATAAPPGVQPILVHFECAEVVAIVLPGPSGSCDFRLERTFPKSPRRPALVPTAARSLSRSTAGALPGSFVAGRLPAADGPCARPPHRALGQGPSSPPGRILSAA